MPRTRGLLSCVAAGLLLTACFGPGTTRTTRLFVLHSTAPSSSGPASDLRLGIGRISLPELLNRPQIVTRMGTNEVRLADFSQWAEPLEQSIPRVLSEDLARRIGTDRVAVYPWPTQLKVDLMVEISIVRFDADADGEVSLVARWRVLRPDGSELHPLRASSYTETSADHSMEAAVAAMSRALGSLSREIASAIQATPR